MNNITIGASGESVAWFDLEICSSSRARRLKPQHFRVSEERENKEQLLAFHFPPVPVIF